MKNVLVSGAAGNLGQVVVQHFAQAGYQVIGTVRKNVPSTSPFVEFIPVNLIDEWESQEFVKTSLAKHGSIRAAALTAGGFTMGSIVETTDTSLDEMLTLNFKTAYHLIRPLFLHMIENGGGTIIVMGAKPAIELTLGRNMLAYTLAKALLLKLVEILNEEGKEKGVTLHALIPGTIDTPDNRKAMPAADYASWVKPETLAAKMLELCEQPFEKGKETIHTF
jgi:NAD(P)-dependent dehydrogenase (short-subunit alcohol dehydrogenase family)